MPTIARVTPDGSAHYYTRSGEPMHEVPRAKGDGMRATTLADARKLNLLPSVTTVLGIVAKPGLVSWQIEQACLSVLTAQKHTEETLDAFVERVLHIDKDQKQESEKAMELGTNVHEAIELAAKGQPFNQAFEPYVTPVLKLLPRFGPIVSTEEIVVGDGCAGRMDLKTEEWVVDYKTCKKIPKDGYREHELQLSAYAMAAKRSKVANIYISTTEPGKVEVVEYENPAGTFADGFWHVLKLWQWMNNYYPCAELPQQP